METRNVSRFNKGKAIERLVREFFTAHAGETFLGLTTTDEVIAAVQARLMERAPNRRFTDLNAGWAYDLICELGPCGEDQVEWLKRWKEIGA